MSVCLGWCNQQLSIRLLQPSTKEPGPSADNEAPGAGGGHQTQSLVTNYLQTTSLFVYVGAWIPCLMFEFDMF